MKSSASQYEIDKWERWFEQALHGVGQEQEQGYFWKTCEKDSLAILNAALADDASKPLRVAELACGAARVSLALAARDDVTKLTLVDGAQTALDFAKTLVDARVRKKIEYRKANIFKTDLPSGEYDLTWNCGVIEHYVPEEMSQILTEMKRVTKNNGTVVVAVPNIKSLAAIKAWTLGKTWLGKRLEWVPGYRYDTEIIYSNRKIIEIARAAGLRDCRIAYAGSPAWVSAAPLLVNLLGRAGRLSGCSFLTYFSFR